MVGGNYLGDSLTTINAAYTVDGGRTWEAVVEGMRPGGYRSCVAIYNEDLVLTVGRQSSDYYRTGDKAYTAMGGKYYAVSVSKDKKTAWASGANGSIARLAFK